MAAKKTKGLNSVFAVLAVLVVAGGALTLNTITQKKVDGATSSYPDNSALGVTYNFYQWYASCMTERAEESDEKSPTPCYQKTTYLSQELVRALDKNQTTVSCGKDLNFHTIGVNVKSEDSSGTLIDVKNSKTGEFISEVTTKYVKNTWQITDISCTEAN